MPGSWPYLRAFWDRAYREGVTGLAAMVAYNLLLAVFPFALLVLFIFGRVLQTPGVEEAVLLDLERLFPDAERDTLREALLRIRNNAGTIGIVAGVAGVWIGTSFWGAMDTAFCRIYHVRCRGWLEQKRWALGMLVVVALFLAATVIIPILEGVLISGADDLPLGLSQLSWLVGALLVLGALAVTFVIGCLIYWIVPKGRVPWRAVWPGALLVTVTVGVLNWVFPVYLSNISAITRFGNTVTFALIALIWFYAISLVLLLGAVVNALRFEMHDTGTLRGLGRMGD